MRALQAGNYYAMDTGNSEYAFCDVVNWLNANGWRVVKVLRGDFDNPSHQITEEIIND